MGGNTTSKQTNDDDEVNCVLGDIINNTENLKTTKLPADCFSSLRQNIAVIDSRFRGLKPMLLNKVLSKERRQNLVLILDLYGQTLQSTLRIATSTYALTEKWESQLRIIKGVHNAPDIETSSAIFESFDREILEEKPQTQDWKDLIAKFEAITALLKKEIAQLQQDEKDAKKKFWLYVGLVALSTVVLAGCITAIVLSAGTAAPLVVAGAAMTAEIVSSLTAGAIAGITIGSVGAATAVATFTYSSAVATKLDTIQKNVNELCAGIRDIGKLSESVSGHETLLEEEFKIVNLLNLPLPKQTSSVKAQVALFRSDAWTDDVFKKKFMEIQTLQDKIKLLREDVKKHFISYLNPLLELKNSLDMPTK